MLRHYAHIHRNAGQHYPQVAQETDLNLDQVHMGGRYLYSIDLIGNL